MVTIQNVRNNGVIRSGFLIGAMSDNVAVTTVEVALDGGAYQAATLTSATSWKFQLPIPSSGTVWRDGSQHTIAVRAKDAANNTGTATIAVRKGVNNDVNGDGYADVAVGAYGASNFDGAAYVFHGSSGGVASADFSAAATTLTGAASSQFGYALAP